jgi:hypothetical protein
MLQLITDLKVVVIVLKLKTFVIHISKFFFLKSNLSYNLIKFLAKDCPKISIASKNPIVICFDYQSTPKKLTTSAMIS